MYASFAGKFLVAMPGIGDPRFERAVIFMCTHTEEAAMGLIVNKPRDALTLGDVLGHLGIDAADELQPRVVLDGGPVRPDRGFVLHSEDFASNDATQPVAPGICLTATREVLEAVGGPDAPRRFVLALGCSGWGAGQLESELAKNAWLVVDCTAEDEIVFDDTHQDKWAAAIRRLGFDPAQLQGDMGRA
ncbi:MAG: YqgE/AlgH family protein [Hyphomonadaceae bacterium]|nr:YqgE/AlgH family protein [Hyphomonadaceae bacterium]